MECFIKIFSILYLISFSGIEEGFGKCNPGSYLNLCGYCVGGRSDKSELEGLDRCGICNGQSDCVKCDGLINSPRRRDICGLCLSPEAEEWNDCRKIDKVHPPVIDLVLETDVIALTVTGAGFQKSFENSTQCLIQPLESQTDNPEIKGLTYEENDIQLKIQLTKTTGAYRIGCSEFEGFAEFTIVDSRKLNVLTVRPSEVEIDEMIQLELEVEGLKMSGSNEKYWCFVKIKGGETLVLEARQKSWNGITCSEFTPVSPGRMVVGVVANEVAAFNENGTGKTGEFSARSKAPKAESAEYSPDLRSIAIMFDRNIQISDCDGSFSPESLKSFGVGFTCSAFGNQLQINLGRDFEITETLAIVPNNSICHAETKEARLSPVAESTVLAISKEKVVPPSVSLSAPSLICTDTEKQPSVKLRISTLGEEKLQHVWSVPPSKKGKNQRENMMIWKNSRAIEAELKNKSGENDILLNRTNLLPGNDYELRLRSTNALGDKHDAVASFTVKDAGSVSVTVTTFPSASAITAEATIVTCKDQSNLRHRWMVDGKVVLEDRKILNIPQGNRGTYNVSCEVFEHRSDKILGRGWSLTEIVNVPGRVIIYPAEAVFGTMDDIVLKAYSDEARFRWACSNSLGESCIAVGSTGKPIEDIISVTSSRIRIPAGTLPVGRYEWTVYSMEEATATVIVSPKIPPLITIPPPSSRVDSTKPLFLNADVGRLKEGCSIRWKSIHKKGYSYFNLAEDVGLGDPIHIRFDDLVTEEREAPLIIPTAGGRWKGLIGNEKYLLRLEAICPEPIPAAHTDITLFVNGPPDVPNFLINPKTGEAVNTKFTIQISRVTDAIQDYPLMYGISCKDQNDDKIFLGTSFFPYFEVSLPPGKVTVTVKVCDIWKSCSKSTQQVTVREPSNISPQTIKNLERDIQNLLLSGDAIEAYGKAITALKTFSAKNLKPELNAISSATESAVKTRIQILSENMRSSSEMVKLSFEFLEQSVSSLKYFPEPNGMVKLLTDFKNSITKLRRIKRGAGTDPAGSILAGEIIRTVFHQDPGYLDNSEDEVNEAHLRKFEFDMCSENLTSFLTQDELTRKDLPKELSVVDDGKAKIVLKKVGVRYRNCLVMARYLRNLPIDLRSLNVFELRVTTKETFEEKGVLVTLPFYDENANRKCFAWGRDWNEICNSDWLLHKMIECRCDTSGFSSIYQDGVKNKTAHKQLMERKLDSIAKRAKALSLNREIDNSKSALTFTNQTIKIKRSADNEPVNENTLKAIFDLHGKILEQNDIESNREEFRADIKKYMIEACSVIQDTNQDSILIESSIVTLEIKKITQNDNKKDMSIVGASNAKLRFNFKTPPRKTCTGIAKYPKDYFGNSSFDRVSDVYDVRLIKDGTVKEEFRSDIKSIAVTMPIQNNISQEVISCMSWNTANGWTPQCTLNSKSNNIITCNCKTPGIFALFTTNTTINNTTLQPVINVTAAAIITNTTITLQMTVPTSTFLTSSTISTTTANITGTILNTTVESPHNETTTLPMAIVVTNSTKSTNASTSTTTALVIENTTTTTTTTTSTTTTTNTNIIPPPRTTAIAQKNSTTNEKNILASVIQNISNLRKNSSLQVSGTFKIDENYKSVVGKNSTIFVESLRKQLAEQLNIPEKAIANIIVKPGSIMVTVLFVDTKELTAEDAIKELVTKLHDGTLSLTGQNSNVLNVPRQDLQIKIGPSGKRNSGRIRLITYGVVAGTCLAIFLFVLGAAYFRRKRSRVLLRLPRLSVDDHPTYRQFHNEFSLDGSSASLARYRREHPFETETIQ